MGVLIKRRYDSPKDAGAESIHRPPSNAANQITAMAMLALVGISLIVLGVLPQPTKEYSTDPHAVPAPPEQAVHDWKFYGNGQLGDFQQGGVYIFSELEITEEFGLYYVSGPVIIENSVFQPSCDLILWATSHILMKNCLVLGELNLNFASNISFVDCQFQITDGLVNVANTITFANSSFIAGRLEFITVGSLLLVGNQIDQSVFEITRYSDATMVLNRFDVGLSEINSRVITECSSVAWSLPGVELGNIYTSIPHTSLIEISDTQYDTYFPALNRASQGLFRSDFPATGDEFPLVLVHQLDAPINFEFDQPPALIFTDALSIPLNLSGFMVAWGYHLDGLPIGEYLPPLTPAFEDTPAITLTDLLDGSHALDLWGIPYFGEAMHTIIEFEVDTTAPEILSITPENDTLVGIAAPTLIITAIEPNLKTAVARINTASFDVPLSTLAVTVPQSIWDLLSDGVVEIQIELTDMGDLSTSAILVLEKDSTAPSVSMLSPTGGSRTNTAPIISVWASEAIIFDTIQIGGGDAISFINNTPLINFDAYPDGEIAFTITGHDLAQNPFTTTSFIIKDTAAPQITISAPAIAGLSLPPLSIHIFGEDLHYANITIGSSVMTITECEFDMDIVSGWDALVHGDTLSISVVAVDDLGNNYTTVHVISKDLIAPEITSEILSSRLIASSDESLSVGITATDEHLKGIYFSLDNAEWVIVEDELAVSDYINEIAINASILSSGFITVYLKAVDWAGNEATTSQQIYVEYSDEVSWLRAAKASIVAHWGYYLLGVAAAGVSIALIKRRRA